MKCSPHHSSLTVDGMIMLKCTYFYNSIGHFTYKMYARICVLLHKYICTLRYNMEHIFTLLLSHAAPKDPFKSKPMSTWW